MTKAKTKTKPQKKVTIHALALEGRAYLDALDRDRQGQALCGIALWYTTDDNGYEVSRRRPTVDLPRARQPTKAWHRGDTKTRKACSACRKLALMNPVDRVAAILKRDGDRQSKAAADKLQRADTKQVKDAELELLIEATRVDALVCLDKLERDQSYLRRCKRVLSVTPIERTGAHMKLSALMTRCNLEKHHVDKCRGNLPGEKTLIDIDEVLAIAIKAQKHASGKPDRGERLYIQRMRYRCQECDWEGYYSNREPCCDHPNIEPDQSLNQKDLICRFCDHVVDHDYKLGGDYSNTTPVVAHCIPCALKFLAEVTTTAQDDAPVLVDALPASSFVLEMDQ